MLDPVTAWVGDRLWTGKPPRRRNRQYQPEPALCARLQWVHCESRKSKQTHRDIAWYTSPYPWSRSVELVPGWTDWPAVISADLREAVAYLRRVHNDALYKSTVILLTNKQHWQLKQHPANITPVLHKKSTSPHRRAHCSPKTGEHLTSKGIFFSQQISNKMQLHKTLACLTSSSAELIIVSFSFCSCCASLSTFCSSRVKSRFRLSRLVTERDLKDDTPSSCFCSSEFFCCR